MAALLSWGIRQKPDKPPRPIGSLEELVREMRGGKPLVKTFIKGDAVYSVGKRTCGPDTVEKALRSGFLRPHDLGLFGAILVKAG